MPFGAGALHPFGEPTTMNAVNTQPAITRDQEQRLYAFLRVSCEGDSLRYELIAKKVMRTADGTASPWEMEIAIDWLNAMLEIEGVSASDHPQSPAGILDAFVAIRQGRSGNAHYQAFLDTLEQDELDKITSNAPFLSWMQSIRKCKPASVRFDSNFVRKCSESSLSQRVIEQRKIRAEAQQ